MYEFGTLDLQSTDTNLSPISADYVCKAFAFEVSWGRDGLCRIRKKKMTGVWAPGSYAGEQIYARDGKARFVCTLVALWYTC